MLPLLPKDLDGKINAVNIDKRFGPDNDLVESGSIVSQRHLVFRATHQIVIGKRI